MAKFTKSFARKMYNSINLEDYKREFSLSINDWKPYHNPKNKNGYLVDVVISWETKSEGPFNGWHQAQYKGILILDEYGCGNMFMIKSKIETKIAFKGSPLSELSEKMINELKEYNQIFQGVQYGYMPNGCLDE